ncbi:MAG: hypothetical protein F6K40_10150 [Okeania sp. SIO3I5]|uniref:hypothetical protein n=1 Tax=Okeania sp. SIO3I5 TaxID=2607805 RepID=UPI0013BD6295|nr:hypothetical protein [Okeania sp. SIO3I5]NEQ36616.1 hypothetical protein [Okeania sp. SIO3I5]
MTEFSDLKSFVDSWEDRFVEVTEFDIFKQSPNGNINTDGTAACCDSPIFTKYHRYFKRSIEPGVRDLTIALILKLNCITYSSCEGHFSTKDAVMRQRYVAVMPRDEEEYQCLFNTFNQIAELTNERFSNNPVKVVMGNDNLELEGKVIKCLTLFFVSNNADEAEYFREIEPVYDYVLENINQSKNQ